MRTGLGGMGAAARSEQKASRPAANSFDPLGVLIPACGATARGGRQDLECDGPPGRLTSWRGAMKLYGTAEYELSRRSRGKLRALTTPARLTPSGRRP